MTNEELVARIKAGIDTGNNMLQLWQQCRLFIHSIARRYYGKAELDDLEQEGYLALYDAVDGFKPEKGYKFLTYAEHWIKQRMQRYIQNNGTVRIPVHEGEKLREYKKVVNTFRIRFGRKPTRREIALNLGVSKEIVAGLEKAARMVELTSLDSYLKLDEQGAVIGDMVPSDVDVEAEVLETVQQEQLKEVLWSLVDALPEEQAQALRLRYKAGKMLKATGESMGSDVNRIKAIEIKALRSLEHSRHARVLKSFLADEDIYSLGLVGNGAARFNTTWTSSTERIAMKTCE